MAKVVATQRGYFGRVLREPGDAFDVPDGSTASWFKPYGGDVASAEPSVETAKPARAKPGPKPKAETVDAPVAEPFADAPEPVRVQNEINAATGGTHPDWLAPNDI